MHKTCYKYIHMGHYLTIVPMCLSVVALRTDTHHGKVRSTPTFILGSGGSGSSYKCAQMCCMLPCYCVCKRVQSLWGEADWRIHA